MLGVWVSAAGLIIATGAAGMTGANAGSGSVTTNLSQSTSAATTGVQVPAVTVTAAARVPGRQIRIKVKGKRFGKKARIKLRGIKGKAKGTKKTVKVKKNKTVKRLKTGKYKITAKKITSGVRVARAKNLDPKRVKITKRRGARTSITYRKVKDSTIGTISLVSTNVLDEPTNGDSQRPSFSPDGTRIVFDSKASNLTFGDTGQSLDVFVKSLGSVAITRASTPGGSGNTQSNGFSFDAEFSPDGTLVTFTSDASNLVPGSTDRTQNVFVRTLAARTIRKVSTDASGNPGNRNSFSPRFSPDGKRIAFSSYASDLVSGDSNKRPDVFLKTLASRSISRVARGVKGQQGNGTSWYPSFSPDGTRIAFESDATNLVSGDTNGFRDIFIRRLDVRPNGSITRVSRTAGGIQGNKSSFGVVYSPDGANVAFLSAASNLVPGDTNASTDVFAKNLISGKITRVSTGNGNRQGNENSLAPVFSPDGTLIAFESKASSLVPGDTNGVKDVFVKTLSTGDLTRVSTDSRNNQSDGPSVDPAFSPDGKQVIFSSRARNLVPDDRNGHADIFIKTIR